MNETEKRRERLLEQTRSIYHDDSKIPAIHPRYEAYYRQIYNCDNNGLKGTCGIRCLICILVFGIYAVTGINQKEIFGLNDLQVREMIMQNIELEVY